MATRLFVLLGTKKCATGESVQQRRWRPDLDAGDRAACPSHGVEMAAGRRRPDPALDRAASGRRGSALGRHIGRRGISYGERRPDLEPRNSGTRRDFLPEAERYPEFGQCVHCIVWHLISRTGFISRTTAACIAATTAAGTGRALRQGCPPASAFPPSPTRATHRRCSCCR